jgi:hypothetical protein
MFVENVPLLYEKRRVARQFQVETWLDLAQVLKELNIGKTSTKPVTVQPNYIV